MPRLVQDGCGIILLVLLRAHATPLSSRRLKKWQITVLWSLYMGPKRVNQDPRRNFSEWKIYISIEVIPLQRRYVHYRGKYRHYRGTRHYSAYCHCWLICAKRFYRHYSACDSDYSGQAALLFNRYYRGTSTGMN